MFSIQPENTKKKEKRGRPSKKEKNKEKDERKSDKNVTEQNVEMVDNNRQVFQWGSLACWPYMDLSGLGPATGSRLSPEFTSSSSHPLICQASNFPKCLFYIILPVYIFPSKVAVLPISSTIFTPIHLRLITAIQSWDPAALPKGEERLLEWVGREDDSWNSL